MAMTSPGDRSFYFHCNLTGSRSHMWSVVDRDVIMGPRLGALNLPLQDIFLIHLLRVSPFRVPTLCSFSCGISLYAGTWLCLTNPTNSTHLHARPGLSTLFYEGPDSKHFRLCRPCGLCCNRSALPLSQESSPGPQ